MVKQSRGPKHLVRSSGGRQELSHQRELQKANDSSEASQRINVVGAVESRV